MAERRMFHTAVVESDAFLDMTPVAQALYFHLGMTADDDGFINGPRQVCRTLGAPMECLQELIDGGFLLWFEGVAVVTHFRLANTLQNDRIKQLRYPEIAKQIYIQPNRIYTLIPGKKRENLFCVKEKNIRDIKRKTKQLLESKWNPKGSKSNTTQSNLTKSNLTQSNLSESNLTQSAVGGGLPDAPESDDLPPACRTDDYLCGEDLPKKKILQLTVEQLHMLYERMGFTAAVRYMDKLSNFIQTHGANIKDHYATIIKWWEEDGGIYL